MTIGSNIIRIRKEKKITQKKLAELSGLSIRGLQDIEYNKSIPKRNTLRKIADALGVPETELDNDLKEKFEEWDKKYNENGKLAEEIELHKIIKQSRELLENFNLMNEDGQKKALDIIKDLSEVPKYTK